MNLVQHISVDAKRRLAILDREAPAMSAAAILSNPNTPLVVVCDSDHIAIGVVSRMDIVRLFSRAGSEVARPTVEQLMTRTFLSCRMDDALQSVWENISAKGLRCLPLLDDLGRPQGVVHARDLVRALLDEVTTEEMLLRDYVLGVGYR